MWPRTLGAPKLGRPSVMLRQEGNSALENRSADGKMRWRSSRGEGSGWLGWVPETGLDLSQNSVSLGRNKLGAQSASVGPPPPNIFTSLQPLTFTLWSPSQQLSFGNLWSECPLSAHLLMGRRLWQFVLKGKFHFSNYMSLLFPVGESAEIEMAKGCLWTHPQVSSFWDSRLYLLWRLTCPHFS